MFSAFKIWAAVITIYYDQNHYQIQLQSDKDDTNRFVGGLQAELLDVDTVDLTERPENVLIAPSDLATNTGCSPDTARRWLSQFADADLLEAYHDSTDSEQSLDLYRLSETDTQTVMRTLHEFDDEIPPYEDESLTEVTPGDFHHMKGSQFAHTPADATDEIIVIDVSEPDDNQSIQQSVIDQLRESGMKASTPRNFVYQLRQKANLT